MRGRKCKQEKGHKGILTENPVSIQTMKVDNNGELYKDLKWTINTHTHPNPHAIIIL